MPPGFGGLLRWLLPIVAAAIFAVAGLVILWWFLEPIADSLGVPADERIDIVRVYLLTVGGGLLIWQVSIANRRAASAERVAELTALGNITGRLSAAIEHLGSGEALVRIGGIYELHHIAGDAADYRTTVLELLRAHLEGIADSVSEVAEISSQRSVEYETVLRVIRQMYVERGVYYEEEENAEDGG